MAFDSCNPSGRWDEVLAHESEDAVTDLLEISFRFRDVFLRARRVLRVVLLFVVCNLFLSVSSLNCRLSFLSLDNASRSQPPSHVFRSLESFSANDLASSAICNCLLLLLLFLCHTFFFQLRIFLFLNFNVLFSLDLVFSCFLGDLRFLFCCHALMTFSILVSRHRSNFYLRDIVHLVRLGPQLALLFVFF